MAYTSIIKQPPRTLTLVLLCFAGVQAGRMPSPPWGREIDHNFLIHEGSVSPALALQNISKADSHSLQGDAQFIATERGDFRVKETSPVLTLGFQNFPMDQFGVRKPSLKAAVDQKPKPSPWRKAPKNSTSGEKSLTKKDTLERTWLGIKVRDILGESDISAYGAPGESGIIVLDAPPESPLGKAGIHKNDVILSINGKPAPASSRLQLLKINKLDFPTLEVLREQEHIMIGLPVNKKSSNPQ